MGAFVGCLPFLLNVFGPGGVVAFVVWWYLRRRGYSVLSSIVLSLAGFVISLIGWILFVYSVMFTYLGYMSCRTLVIDALEEFDIIWEYWDWAN